MRILKMICLLVTLVCTTVVFAGSGVKQKAVYVFGYAQSNSDSLIYVTDIQRIDTAFLVKKGGFLLGRQVFSEQLRSFLDHSYGSKNAICNIFFSTKRSTLVKTYDRVTLRVNNNDDFRLCFLGQQVMQFRPVSLDEATFDERRAPVQSHKRKSKKKK